MKRHSTEIDDAELHEPESDSKHPKLAENESLKELDKAMYGQCPRISMVFCGKSAPYKLRAAHFHEMIQWLLLSDSMNPRWLRIRGKPLIQRVSWMIVHNPDNLDFHPIRIGDIPKRRMLQIIPSVRLQDLFWMADDEERMMRKARRSRSGVASVVQELGASSSSTVQKRVVPSESMLQEFEVSLDGISPYVRLNDAFSGPYLPDIECVDCASESAFCIERSGVKNRSRGHEGTYDVLAVDCEMVLTSVGRELARVAVVGPNRSVLLDVLVKPEGQVTDYLTRYSGITEDHLRNVSRTRQEALDLLLSLMHSETVLVGHGLYNDLSALGCGGCRHFRTSDTANLYPHHEPEKHCHALRFLSKKFLGREIQTGSNGHCPSEDALAVMDLVKAKVMFGAEFGVDRERERKKLHLLAKVSSEVPSFVVASAGHSILSDLPMTSKLSVSSCIDGAAVRDTFCKQSESSTPKFVVGVHAPADFETAEHFSNSVLKVFDALPMNSIMLVSVIHGRDESTSRDGTFCYLVKRHAEGNDSD